MRFRQFPDRVFRHLDRKVEFIFRQLNLQLLVLVIRLVISVDLLNSSHKVIRSIILFR